MYRPAWKPIKTPKLVLVLGTDAFRTRLVARAADRTDERVVAVSAPRPAGTRLRGCDAWLLDAEHLALVYDEPPARVEGWTKPITWTAVTSSDGWLYWAEAGDQAGDPDCVMVWRGGGVTRHYSDHGVITHVTMAGGRGAVAIVVATATAQDLVHLGTDGSVQSRTRLGPAGVTNLVGAEGHNYVALGYGTSRFGEVVELGSLERLWLLDPGWRPLSWTRDGRCCLLALAEELARFDLRTGRMTRLPSASDYVIDACWVPSRRSEHLGRAPIGRVPGNLFEGCGLYARISSDGESDGGCDS